MKPAPPNLIANLTQAEDSVRLEWTVANQATEPLYVCVRTNIGNELFPHPYAYLRENDSVLTMTYSTLSIPPNQEYFAPDIPFFRLLESGQSTNEDVNIPVPIREIHPYCSRTYPEKSIQVRVQKIVFSVEWLWAKDRHFARHTKHDPDLVKAGGSPKHLLEKVLLLRKPMLVLKRTDAFYRYE